MAVFKPTGTLHCVTELTPELLKALNVHMIVLDVDNTMSPHGSQTPFPGVAGVGTKRNGKRRQADRCFQQLQKTCGALCRAV